MRLPCPRSVSVLASLFLVACATNKVVPPAVPEMPAAPEVVLDELPLPPSLAPKPPVPPGYTLPKATDVAWQSVWQEDFVNDSAPRPVPVAKVTPAALVSSGTASEPARLGMVSGLLSIDVAAADMGKDVAAELRMEDKGALIAHSLHLLDPIGRWTFSEAFKAPAVKSAFVVRVYAQEQVSKRVVKFDIQPHLQQLAEYNEKVVAYQSKREAHLADRAKYDQQFAEYLRAMQSWRTAMTARIEEARRRHDEDSRRIEVEHTQRWDAYRRQAAEKGNVAAPQPELVRKPFQAPTLPEPRTAEPASIPDALATLSLDQMRDLLLAIATEAVPATSVRLGGQFVDVGTGLTIATVDATLVLPTGSGRTEAGMLRELMVRLAR